MGGLVGAGSRRETAQCVGAFVRKIVRLKRKRARERDRERYTFKAAKFLETIPVVSL